MQTAGTGVPSRAPIARTRSASLTSARSTDPEMCASRSSSRTWPTRSTSGSCAVSRRPPAGTACCPGANWTSRRRRAAHPRVWGFPARLGSAIRNAWPMFRSYSPSLFPWFLEAGEVRFLSCALEQLADVAPRFREDPSLLEPSGGDSYLLRVPRQEGGGEGDPRAPRERPRGRFAFAPSRGSRYACKTGAVARPHGRRWSAS